MNLRNADFTTNRRLANVINDTFGMGTAEALDAVSTRILAPSDMNQRVAFMSMIENLEIEPAAPPARIGGEFTYRYCGNKPQCTS